MRHHSFLNIFLSITCLVASSLTLAAKENVIEKRLKEIGTVENREIISVQRKFTRKNWRHEISPMILGGIPFGTIRRTLTGGFGYAYHLTDWIAIDTNFIFTRNFFSRFTDDISDANPIKVRPDVQKLLLFGSAGLQISPFYGKMATFSRWIVYMEPFFTIGAGISKTETNNYISVVAGAGIRSFFKEWLSVKLELKDIIYNEVTKKTTGDVESLRHNFAIMVSLSFWIPKL